MPNNKVNVFLEQHYREEVWAGILRSIDEQEKRKKVKHISRQWLKYAAAILVIAGIWTVVRAASRSTAPASLLSRHVKIINPTTCIYKVTLPDASAMILYPNAEVVYRQPFGSADRSMYLKGRAFFDVAKNKHFPFRVYSDSVVTTALGTSFTIITDSMPGEVTVFLHSGNVLVEQNCTHSGKKVLMPGETVNCTPTGFSAIAKKIPAIVKPALPVGRQRSSPQSFTLEFEQEPLSHVLKKISFGFALSLKYNSGELDDLYFSGKIRSTDKPLRVLQRIASLHDLTLAENRTGYLIKKN